MRTRAFICVCAYRQYVRVVSHGGGRGGVLGSGGGVSVRHIRNQREALLPLEGLARGQGWTELADPRIGPSRSV